MAISKETGEETVHASLIQQSKDEMSFPFPDRPSTFTGNPMMLLDHAVTQGKDLQLIEKLMDLADRWNDQQSRNDYNLAQAEFRREAIVIPKSRQVSFVNSRGTLTEYKHAELGDILNAVSPIMARNGLRPSFSFEQRDGGVEVTCTITHASGWSESNSLHAGLDTSGGKNALQSIGSTLSYLERYTFLGLMGLSTYTEDDDGVGFNPGTSLLSEDQIGTLQGLINTTDTITADFCEWLGVPGLEDIEQKDYERALTQLQRKKVKQQKGAQEAKDADA